MVPSARATREAILALAAFAPFAFIGAFFSSDPPRDAVRFDYAIFSSPYTPVFPSADSVKSSDTTRTSKDSTIVPEGGSATDSLSKESSGHLEKNHALESQDTARHTADTLFGLQPASVQFLKDSLAKRDSVKALKRDSTARIDQFLYRRNDSPVVTTFLAEPYPLFLKTPSIVQRDVTIDSTGQYVIIRETVNGRDVKIPVKMPLDEYIQQRSRYEVNRNFGEMVHKVEEVRKRDELGDILGTFTNIDIPVPANPVFSIFGPPRINLHISGAVDIRAAFRNTTTDQVTTSRLGNTRNEPDFAQEVQINVSGTIGDKLNILADWNTQRTFEYENQLRIKYTGYDDEVVQSVEAGNVSLATSSSFISSSSALFGIKSVFQFGPLKLTALASQKKGQIQEKTVTGGSQEVPFDLRAWQYSRDHYFVDTSYIKTFEPYYTTLQGNSEIQIVDFEVWVTHLGPDDPNQRQAVALLSLPPVLAGDTITYSRIRDSAKSKDGEVEIGIWDELNKKDYTVHDYTGYITLNKSVQDNQAIAIAYRVANGPGPADDSYYGTFKSSLPQGSVLVLKLIKPKYLLPQFKVPWRMMLKNIYPLGGRNVKNEGFALDIKYKPSSGDPEPKIQTTNILELFGLDNYSDDGSPKPDGKFDYKPGLTIDEVRGEIIFPNVEPFRDGLRKSFDKYKISLPPDSFIYREVYDTTVLAAQNNSLRDRFYIQGKSTAGSSNTINLGFNIVENSVQVLLNGQPLQANIDFTVDYIIGQVIIKNQAALVPGANLQIKYEQNDLFQLASKTLLGTRGDMKLSDRTSLGFTVMNLNQQTLSDKVRLNEEPINNTIYGIDGQTGAELDFLTKAIDGLPFISTKAKSDFTLRGEAAYMSPDPNTKKSPINIDNGKGIAYIDDFEGAKRTIPLGVGYGVWHDMSPPAYQYGVDPLPVPGFAVPDTVDYKRRIYSKAKTYWYNRLPSDVRVADIWPEKKVARAQDLVTVLTVNYDAQERGAYNYSPSLHQTLLVDPKRNWSGMQRLLSTGAVDLVRENINFIEVWVRIEPGSKGVIDSTKKVLIDLGAISEDVIPNRKLDTEDKGEFKNGILNEGEDTGIDGITDEQERAAHAAFVEANKADFPRIQSDPAGDDWSYVNTSDFRFINGTEDNKNSEIGRFPDTEDLNHNNVLDRTNSYFEYELNLDTSAANPQRVGGGTNSWYQYRIPLINYKTKVGAPDFSLVEFVRLWFTGFDGAVQLRIAEFNLVGNQWEEIKKNDSTFSLTVVNIEDNPGEYVSPPGVIRERDRTHPDEQVFGNEQSLDMVIRGMKPRDSRQAIKRFTYRPLDVFSYRKMKMFVHGDRNWHTATGTADADIFLRFGDDTLNYYEYRAPVYPGWDPRNNVEITFEDLTAIKQGRDSANVRVTAPAKGGPAGATYSVFGNPRLTSITFISAGIINPARNGEILLSGEVWINELRLSEVDDTPGWAYNVSTSVKFADFGSAAFTYSEVDPNFHALEQRFGSRSTNRSWNISTNFSFERLLPPEWVGTSFPFSYSHSEGLTKPKYLPSSDIAVPKAAERQREKTGSARDYDRIIVESQTLSTTDTYALPTFRVSIPSDHWYLRDLLNKMTYGFTYTTTNLRNPTIQFQESWSWNARMAYGYATAPDNFLSPFEVLSGVPVLEELKDVRLYYPLQSINMSLAATRSQTHQRIRNQPKENEPTRGLSASRSLAFSWKLTENGFLNLSGDYSLDISSTLVHLETDRLKRQREFSGILGDLFLKDQLINFGHDNSYSQTVNINSRPRVPNIFDINKYFTLTSRYQVSYRWTNSLQQGDLGIGTSWGNSISMSSDVSLKQFVETWFPAKKAGEAGAEQQLPEGPMRGRRHDEEEKPPEEPKPPEERPMVPAIPQVPDSTAKPPSVTKSRPSVSLKSSLTEIARVLIKTPLLDYDKVNVTFTQSNSSSNSGVPGRPGFANLFGRVPFVQEADPQYGPSRAYQLGLVSEPTTNITDMHFRRTFPFFGFATDRGVRAASANITDGFTQNNKIALRTNRDLWTGVHIDLSWNVGWDYSRNLTYRTDSLGVPTLISTSTLGAIERSFFTMPPVFIFSIFKSGIGEVGKQYNTLRNNTSDKRPNEAKLAEAFESGFESLPIFRKIFGQYLPRFNYTLRWDGLEQLQIFRGFATRVGLDHAYTSSYRRSFKGNLSGGELTESQRVMYQFNPLLGLSIQFKEIFKGNVSANVRYGATTSYDLIPSSKNIVESSSREMSITGSFGRSGFEIPFFGVSLSNDIDISFSYSYSKTSRQTFATDNITEKGVPGEGSSRSTMEPRIRYVLSSRVTASLFYRYTKITPDEGGSRIPGSSTNEGGLDVHISIQ